ncbi:FAD/NAD(P)-binding domain-containing protein [Microthyrium microscopicum]|uniref:FAD/NAD(P)-binding domain-containing protein n=1 Tax=Microthyrium microscopicum TaxID=703497 RepID=A0A6A6TVE5_9PEZI|nr:FAD/NAD(P)-binding domain-containing protein [Microthyrium microscopicum]
MSTSSRADEPTKRIAIVGSGVSGLGALYALRETHHEVHLYEAADRLGGHTNTIQWTCPDGDTVPVDSGFIVINTATYPNLLNFLDQMDVDTVPTDMTFSVSRDAGAFEWAGKNPLTLFCQWTNLFNFYHWVMLYDLIRFNAFATDLLRDPKCDQNSMSIGEYLDQGGYSQSFRDNYLLPMTACVWSTGPRKCALDFPAVTLIRFMNNHQLLNTVSGRAKWLTIPGGSQRYIDALMDQFPEERVHLNSEVISITTHKIKKGKKTELILTTEDGDDAIFDDVILACHGDQAARLLKQSTSGWLAEHDVLKNFKTSENIAYVHSDISLLPKRPAAWSAWNYLTSTSPESPANPASTTVSLTYNMNILQHLDVEECDNVLVTLNPPKMPVKELIQYEIPYRHPIYTNEAVKAQADLGKIQGDRGIWFAGAWTGYGFHEDGFTSGLDVGLKVGGGEIPFEFVDSRKSNKLPEHRFSDLVG